MIYSHVNEYQKVKIEVVILDIDIDIAFFSF